MMSRTILALVLAVALGTTSLAQRDGRLVSGTVISAESGRFQPVAGASVQYDEGDLPIRTTTTNEEGYFYFTRFSSPATFGGIAPIDHSAGGLGVVTVTADGFATAYRRWPPLDGYALRILLDFPAVLQGTVEDAGTGLPVDAGITVTVEGGDREYESNQYGGGIVSVSTDTRSGVFNIGDLPGGSATIIANAEGFAPFWSELTINAGESRETQIRLLLEAKVTGTVLDADGSPVHAAYVTASYSDATDTYGQLESFVGGAPWTNTDGAFGFYGLIPNVPIRLRAELDDGTLSDIVTVTVPSGTVQENVVLRFP